MSKLNYVGLIIHFDSMCHLNWKNKHHNEQKYIGQNGPTNGNILDVHTWMHIIVIFEVSITNISGVIDKNVAKENNTSAECEI